MQITIFDTLLGKIQYFIYPKRFQLFTRYRAWNICSEFRIRSRGQSWPKGGSPFSSTSFRTVERCWKWRASHGCDVIKMSPNYTRHTYFTQLIKPGYQEHEALNHHVLWGNDFHDPERIVSWISSSCFSKSIQACAPRLISSLLHAFPL